MHERNPLMRHTNAHAHICLSMIHTFAAEVTLDGDSLIYHLGELRAAATSPFPSTQSLNGRLSVRKLVTGKQNNVYVPINAFVDVSFCSVCYFYLTSFPLKKPPV